MKSFIFLFLTLFLVLNLPIVYADSKGTWTINVPQNDLAFHSFHLDEGDEFIGNLVSTSTSFRKSVTVEIDDPDMNSLARYPLVSSTQISCKAIKSGQYTITIWNNVSPDSSSSKTVTIEYVIKSKVGGIPAYSAESIILGFIIIIIYLNISQARACDQHIVIKKA